MCETHEGGRVIRRASWLAGTGLVLAMGAGTAAQAQSDPAQDALNQALRARLDAIEEVVQRMEFDAARLNDPPEHAVARRLLVADFCAISMIGQYVRFTLGKLNWTLGMVKRAEADAPLTSIGRIAAEADLSLSTFLQGGVVESIRFCIDVVPWMQLVHYGGAGADAPGEVYSSPGAMAYGMHRDFSHREVLAGLSPDALAFLQAGAAALFQEQDGMPMLVAQAADRARTELPGGSLALLQSLDRLKELYLDEPFPVGSFGQALFQRVSSSFAAATQILPTAPSMAWAPAAFATASLQDFSPCNAIGTGTLGGSVLPAFLVQALESSCQYQQQFGFPPALHLGEVAPAAADLNTAVSRVNEVVGHINSIRTYLSVARSNLSNAYDSALHYVNQRLDQMKSALETFKSAFP